MNEFEEAEGERSWRHQKGIDFQPEVWCGLGWEKRVASSEMAGKSGGRGTVR